FRGEQLDHVRLGVHMREVIRVRTAESVLRGGCSRHARLLVSRRRHGVTMRPRPTGSDPANLVVRDYRGGVAANYPGVPTISGADVPQLVNAVKAVRVRPVVAEFRAIRGAPMAAVRRARPP